MSESPFDPDEISADNVSLPSRKQPYLTASMGIVAFIRRLPRAVWLACSVGLLLSGSLGWYIRQRDWRYTPLDISPQFFSAQWWNEPLVRNAGAALPEITGRLHAVAVENQKAGTVRIWVAGTQGFLAYSDDDGHCWVPFEYDKEKGEFHEPDASPCETQAVVRVPWPDLVPSVLAAEPVQSGSAPRQQGASPEQRSSPPSNTKANVSGQQQVARRSGAVLVSTTSINFGDVKLPEPTPNQGPGTTLTKSFAVTSTTTETVEPYFSDFRGDLQHEFSLRSEKCQHALHQGETCDVAVVFTPRKPGPKDVTITVRNNLANDATTVSISAVVYGAERTQTAPGPGPASINAGDTSNKSGPASSNAGDTSSKTSPVPNKPVTSTPPPIRTPSIPTGGPEVTPKPPSAVPDLLAIEFSPDGKMVSTGGLLWTRTAENTWVYEPMRRGASEKIGGFTWSFAGAEQDHWATETRVEKAAALSLPSEVYKCGGCTIRSRASAPRGKEKWAAGWMTDRSGDHSILFRSQDGGTNWQPMTRGGLAADQRASAMAGRLWMWPPRWYLAVLLMSLVLALPALLPPPDRELQSAEKSKTGGVEGRLSSDKPLEPADPDVLGLTSISLGLSRFLRNKKTLPPLTVAINGEWGTGKSSLMNLLRCDLRSYEMCPVWFNAWHHQKEEHLLAALLQTVRLEAVPPMWNLLGIPFRWRLLSRRLRRRWPLLLLIAVVVTFAIGLDLHLRVDHKTDLFLWFVGQFFPSSSPKTAPPPFPLQGGLLAVIAVIGTLWKGLTAFGAKPAALLASVAEGNKMKDLEAQTSFRQKFAVEFRDFTRALGPRRPLVIFIDDLDRCLPANVRDVLEAVNFLVSSGDCFVVLGMDRVQVQRAVGLSFKEVAEEADPKRNGNSNSTSGEAAAEAASHLPDFQVSLSAGSTETAREKRREFAQKYLEKLINLEVRVPLAMDEETKRKLFERPPAKPKEPARERILRVGLETLRGIVPVALAVLVVGGTWRLSMKSVPVVEAWIKAPMEANSQTGKVGSSAVSTSAPAAKASISLPISSKALLATDKTQMQGELVSPLGGPAPSISSGKRAWPATWMLSLPLYLLALFLLLVAQVVLTTRPGVETQDSPQFTDAMDKVWYPLVLAKQNTPRAAKRFINRVRYLAMRQRREEEKVSWWEKALFPQRLKEPVEPVGAANWSPIPEPLLVALAAIEQIEPAWIYNDELFHALVNADDAKLSLATLPTQERETIDFLKRCRDEHKKAFSDSKYVKQHADWKSVSSYRDTFLKIWPRVAAEETV